MAQRTPRWQSRQRRALTAALCLLYPLTTADIAAETSVHRCTRPDGGVEFSQFPCPTGSSGEQIVVEDRKTGWTPAKSGPREQQRADRRPGSGTRKASANRDAADARREDRCWKKRQLLDEVNWRLRRGYKPSKGIELRRRRARYEDYIARFCD
jgi:hypothetical protein